MLEGIDPPGKSVTAAVAVMPYPSSRRRKQAHWEIARGSRGSQSTLGMRALEEMNEHSISLAAAIHGASLLNQELI